MTFGRTNLRQINGRSSAAIALQAKQEYTESLVFHQVQTFPVVEVTLRRG